MRFSISRAKVQTCVLPLTTFLFLPFNEATAAGYGVHENSASYLATAFAGRASNPQDASIIANNPAGASFVEGRQISAGGAVILKGGEFEGRHEVERAGNKIDVIAAGKTKDFQATTPVPFGHIVIPYNDKLSFGLAGYAPYGIELDYDKSWPGRVFGNKTSVKVINLQGGVSYKLQDNFSIGFGLIGSYVLGELTQDIYVRVLPPSEYPSGKVEGDATTASWNVGALWKVTDKTSIGVAYHDKLDFTLKGTNKVESSLLNGKEDATLKITMPERFAMSLTQKLDEQWTLMAEATWTRWSRFETFHVEAGDLSSYVPMGWKDVWAFSVGGSYQLTEQWLLRAGYMLDQSPVQDDTRTVRSPDSDRNWYTFGANWKPNKTLSVDVSYAYVSLKDSTIAEKKHELINGVDTVDSAYGSIKGNYTNSSHILTAQLNYLF